MIYEAYEKKVRRYVPLARIWKICVKCAILLLILGAVLLLGYLSLRGIHFGTYTLQSETVAFGDKPDFDCFVLFGTYRCEYARQGSENWEAEQPTAPGTYEVRAVITKGLFGKQVYSEAGTVTLYCRDVTLRPEGKSAKFEYGEEPAFGKHWKISDRALAKGHSVESAKLSYFTYDGQGGAICHIDPSSVVIRDKQGNDVTAGYTLRFLQGTIKVKSKQITIVVADEIKNGRPVNITKVYDGQSASTANFKLTKGSLYRGDTVFVTPHSVSADVGRHDNKVSVTITNQAGQDRTAYYNVKVDVCKVVIEKRPLAVSTPDVTLVYNGMRQYADQYAIESGSLVPGQRVEFVHNDKTGVTEVTKSPQENRVQLKITQDGRDVTRNYDITYEYGSLTVAPCKVHLRSGDSYGLVYNGKEQSWQEYRIYSGTLGVGHSVKIKKAATLKTPGSVKNELDFAIVSGSGKDVTKNYDLTVSYGTLTIERGAYLQLSYKDLRKIYDAAPLAAEQYNASELLTVTAGTLFEGDTIEIVSASGTQTDAGISTYTVTYRIMHKEGLGKAVDATNWYASNLQGTGRLIVDKRSLEIRFDPKTKQYDGSAISAPYPAYLSTTATNGWLRNFEGKGHKIKMVGNFYDHVTYQKNGVPVSQPLEVGSYTYTVPDELFRVVLDDGSGADRTHNYDFYLTGNTIEIKGIALTLTAPSGSKVYDGEPLSAEDFSLRDVRLSWSVQDSRYTASYTLSGSQTNAGTGSLNVQNVQIWDRSGNNVTPNFEIKTVPGKLTVTPISISVKTSSGSKVYDGQPMDNATQVTLTGGKLIAGHSLGGAVKADYVTDVGTHDNDRITPKVYSATGQDVSGNYLITINPGRYTVKPATLHIATPLVQGEYSGQPYSGKCDATASAKGLVNGQKVELEVVSDGIELGLHPMHVTGYRVLDARGRDVTGNYTVTCEDGQIEIVPRKVTVVTGSSTVAYDQAPAKSSEIRTSGLLEGHEVRATFTYPRGIFEIGQTEINSLETIRIVDADGRDVTAYYNIRTNYGTLRVKPIEITISTADAYKDVYDGQPLYMPHYVIVKGECLAGHELHVTFKYQNDGPCDVGRWKNELTSVRVTDEQGNDVSYMYAFTVNEGTLEIANPYVLPMQTFDAEKMYDGTPLLDEQYALLGELLPGHTIAGITPVGIDLVGEMENRLTLIIMDERGRDVSANYAFFYDEGMLGMLRITHRPLQFIRMDDHIVLTYNGTTKLPVSQAQIEVEGLVAGQKIMLPMHVESPEIGRKFTYAFGDMRIYDVRGRDVTHCYHFEVPSASSWLQSVTVEPAELQLYLPERYSKEYDGTGVDAAQAGYRPMGLASGHRVEYVANVTPAEPGNYTLAFSEWVVYDGFGIDVTENYKVTANACRVSVNPLYVKLTSADASRHYNGQPLICEKLLPYRLPAGFSLDVVFTGAQTEVGKSENTFTVTVYDQNGNDITAYCSIAKSFGTLEVWDQIKLTLKSNSEMMIYDGTPLICHELGAYKLPEGYSMEVFFTGEQVEPGISDNTFYVEIFDENGEVVTDSFDIRYEYGKLHVVRAEDWVVTLTSKDADKNYDGTPLTMHELAPYDLPRGFYLDVTFTGKQVEIGTSANTFTARVYNDAGQELRVEYVYGTLEVHLDIVVNAYEMTYTYDGTEKNCEDVWVQGLPEGYRVEVAFGKGLTVTGTKDVEFEKVTVYDARGNDVTHLCNLTLNSAKLTVLPRILTVYVYGQSADSIAPVQGELVKGHTMFAEYGERGECYIEITDARGELVYSNRGDSPVRYTLYDVIIQYG